MFRLKSHISFLLICVLAFFTLQSTDAQQRIAVELIIPEEADVFNEQLSYLKQHNTDLLILEGGFNDSALFTVIKSDIPFILKMDHPFLTRQGFESTKQNIFNDISILNSSLDTVDTFQGIIASRHSMVDKSEFQHYGNIFFQQGDSLVNTENLITAYYCNIGNGTVNNSLALFKECLISDKNIYSVFEFSSLRSVIDNNSYLKNTLMEDSFEASSIALPKTSESFPLIHWSTIVLLGLWISLTVNIKLNPTYYETIPRYFTAHRFFVDDIMSYRERSSLSGIFLLFQHALFGGLITYILARVFISGIGIEALYYHLPYLGIMGKNYFSLFVVSSLLVFVVELIALIWIYAPNSELSHFNQVLNLFTWIFHLDFVIGTLIVTMYFAGFGSVSISILSVIYVLIWFSSFNITSLNASKKLGIKRNSYLLKTIGLHTLVSIGLVILLFYFDGWWDLLELVVWV